MEDVNHFLLPLQMPCLLALFLLTVEPQVSLKLTPQFSAATSQDVRAVVRIAPHHLNKLLVLILDGPEYRRSDTTLEGEDAPRLIDTWFKGVRAEGDYVAAAIVYRSDGTTQRDKQTFCKAGADHHC